MYIYIIYQIIKNNYNYEDFTIDYKLHIFDPLLSSSNRIILKCL